MVLGVGIELIGLREHEGGDRDAGPAPQSAFTAAELAYCESMARPLPHFAVRWAAKRAFRKALGDPAGDPCDWRDIEVARDDRGKPLLRVSGGFAERLEALGVRRVHLSLTHSDEDAAALVLFEG